MLHSKTEDILQVKMPNLLIFEFIKKMSLLHGPDSIRYKPLKERLGLPGGRNSPAALKK